MKAVEKVQVKEVDGEGLIGLIGKQVTVWCMNYIYTGTLEGVNSTCIKLNPAKVVYETGSLMDKTWKAAQDVPNGLYIQIGAIESFMELNK